MTRSTLARALGLGLGVTLLAAAAMADSLEAAGNGVLPDSVAINSMWVIVAAMVVFFMQAGFAFLEIGFSRGKNAGTVVAKILTNFSIAAICWWACGFALAFGVGTIAGSDGFFLQDFGDPQEAFPVMGLSDATIESKFFFQFAFCAVSLAIVWGTTLERVEFGVYIIYSIVFASLIYPLGAHWVFGGGFLQTGDWLGTGIAGMQDFAGSTAVHLIGATGALAALLLLGPRRGKYDAAGRPRAIPGHNMPLFGLGVLILWLGWFGFNPGSTLGALDGRFPEVLRRHATSPHPPVRHDRPRHRDVEGASVEPDLGMAGNWRARCAGRHHGALGLRGAVDGAADRRCRGRHRAAGDLRDRQEDRRSGGRADGARDLRCLGHDLLRHLHGAAAGRVQRVR